MRNAYLPLQNDNSYYLRIDQTTRIHGAVPQVNGPATWYELGRPQVHGYDILGSVFLKELKFASIADEKVLRIFEAPRRFVDLMEILHVSQFSENEVCWVRLNSLDLE